MMLNKILAVAVSSECVGIVYYCNGEVADTGISRKAYTDTHKAICFMQEWIDCYQPSIIITERFAHNTRRGKRAIELSKVLAVIASHHRAYDIAIVADREGRTRFEHAVYLAQIYPTIAYRLPKKNRIWESENRAMVLFPAMGLIHQVLQQPAYTLAANLDGDEPLHQGSQ